jgi:protein-arginine kinase activator protein McsA
MKCSICHKEKPTIAVLLPDEKHERRVCFSCLYEKFLEWSDYTQ